MKTCLWCAAPCPEYFIFIAPKANEMFGQDATAFRRQTAENCTEYVEAMA